MKRLLLLITFTVMSLMAVFAYDVEIDGICYNLVKKHAVVTYYSRGGHQGFLHDDQNASVKMVLERFSPNDKSVWQKVAAWLLSSAKRFG